MNYFGRIVDEDEQWYIVKRIQIIQLSRHINVAVEDSLGCSGEFCIHVAGDFAPRGVHGDLYDRQRVDTNLRKKLDGVLNGALS